MTSKKEGWDKVRLIGAKKKVVKDWKLYEMVVHCLLEPPGGKSGIEQLQEG